MRLLTLLAPRAAAAACACILLSACGGIAQTALPSTGAGAIVPDRVHASKATVVVRVHVPAFATKGMTIAYSGTSKAQQVLNVTASGPGCKSSASSLVCTSDVELDAGSYAAAIAVYDKSPVKGRIPPGAKLLSSAKNIPVSVKAGTGNTFGLLLGGDPKGLVLGALPSGVAGTAFASSKALVVTAKDATGDVIVGTYGKPITLADSDNSGATAIATAGGDRPNSGTLLSSSDTASMSYTGLAISPIVIAASATGAKSARANFTPLLHAIGPASLAGFVYLNPFGASSPVTFAASEIGWTNPPYDRDLAAQLSSGCNSVATVTPSAGVTFTASLVASPSDGDCSLWLSDGAGQILHIPIGYATFSYTGAAQSFPVPASVNQLTIAAAGAQGGTAPYGGTGGAGGSVTATIPVTSFESLGVYVGGAGAIGGGAGFNGGGGSSGSSGASGGDASDVRDGGGAYGNRVIVAGGGGASTTGNGGAGGYPSGGAGCAINYAPATGGTQSAGGAGGPGDNGAGPDETGGSGQLGLGGTAAFGHQGPNGGGGGGGYYGGGGGGGGGFDQAGGCGAGGSSYAEPSATNVTYGTGTQTGNGAITITY